MTGSDLREVVLPRRGVPRPWTELSMAAALIAMVLLQSSWEGVLSVFGQLPDLALIALVIWGVRSRRRAVLWAAIGTGALADILAGTVPGGQSAALMLAVAPASTWRFVLFGSTLVWAVLAAAGATAIYYLVFGALLSLQGLEVAAGPALAAGATAVLLNCSITGLVHWITDRVQSYLWPRTLPVREPGNAAGGWR